jgi:hypothetical protein
MDVFNTVLMSQTLSEISFHNSVTVNAKTKILKYLEDKLED